MKKPKDYTLLAMAIPFILAVLFNLPACYTSGNKPAISKQPVSIEYFIDGQILLPDYACPDTLIVMDAENLNKDFAFVEQDISWGTDADCDSLLHCTNKQGLLRCMTFEQYIEHLDGTGYRKDIALHLALVDFGRKEADELYHSIMED